MPKVQASQLKKICEGLLIGSGANEEEASIISRHSIGANLAGHDSHGIIAIPTYVERVKRGHIVPGAPLTYCKTRLQQPLLMATGDTGM